MYYRHNLDYTYPERSDQHMLELKRTRELYPCTLEIKVEGSSLS